MGSVKAESFNVLRETLESTTIPLVQADILQDAQLQVENIKLNNDGYTAVGLKDSVRHWVQWHVRNDELSKVLPKLLKFKDVYISINSMLSPVRQLSNIRHLQAFWVDLDYYKIKRFKNKSAEEMIDHMRKMGHFKEMEPSFFVDSGNGMYIFYLIESATKNALPIWQKIQNKLVEKFTKYGADPLSADAVHVLRLSGTVNSKTGRRARFIYNTSKRFDFENSGEDIKRYTIPKMAEAFLPALPKSKEEWKSIKESKKKTKKILNSKKEIALYNLHTLHYARLNDIRELQRVRNGNCSGYRELMTFLFRYYSCLFQKDEELALASTIDFNSQFTNPLDEKEVIKATKSAEIAYAKWAKAFSEYINLKEKPNMKTFLSKQGCYIYSNAKLIKLLEIKESEMESMSTLISVKEKNKRSKGYRNEWKKEESKKKHRNNAGLTSRQQKKMDNLLKILDLKEKGYKQLEISKTLKITQQAVSKLLNEWKNNKIGDEIMAEINAIKASNTKVSERNNKVLNISEIQTRKLS